MMYIIIVCETFTTNPIYQISEFLSATNIMRAEARINTPFLRAS